MINTEQAATFAQATDAIKRTKNITVSGLIGSSRALFLAHLISEGQAFCLITSTQKHAELLHGEITFFLSVSEGPLFSPLLLFPPWDVSPHLQASGPSPDCMARRIATLHHLATSNRPVSVITPIEAFIQKVPLRAGLLNQTFTLHVGDGIAQEVLIEKLNALHYERVGSIVQPGEYAVRGGITDIYPALSDGPVRLEFFGDYIETIRLFDLRTQKSLAPLASVPITIGREITSDPAFYEAPFLSALPEAMLLVIVEPEDVKRKGEGVLKAVEDAVLFAPPSQGSAVRARYLPNALPDAMKDRVTISLTLLSLSTGLELEHKSGPGVEHFVCDTQSLASLGFGSPESVFSETAKRLETLRQTFLMIVAVEDESRADHLKRLLAEYDIPCAMWEPMPMASPSPIYLAVGALSEGFSCPHMDLIVLTEKALLGTSRRRQTEKKKHSAGVFLKSLQELQISDTVVHLQHGIGRYKGLKRLSVRTGERGPAIETDFLVLEYAGGATIYVPVDALHLVQRYIGLDGETPALDHLGGTRWAQAKSRAKRCIQDMTQELLTLYAERSVVKRLPFVTHPLKAEAFASAFAYEETPDQQSAIEDVLSDMDGTKPMDRLICGDVGYGKTEVAMRAAFAAVSNGKQVAVLAPTTLLARQHHWVFSQRFAPFDIKVDWVSRLLFGRERREALNRLKNGLTDIMIGTHLLLNKTVIFANLGLIILDEEHRFGVRHKEYLKQMKKEVDVLTLTATPIPRTLQMALAQVRDLSVIETAPANRLAIETRLVPFKPGLIKEAIFRELVRGGQVFFIHNRVASIERISLFISELVPQARVAVAHGQMGEHLLEATMTKFIAGETNVLVTTTIIESGIDIPSANTIFINHADQFGLAELYQLRGRVGRSYEQAYAYLLVPEERMLSESARQRLAAIQEFTALGSGFQVAARDLEIRGAGHLLGQEQSGQIAAIGFELYLKMIEERVAVLKGREVRSPTTLEVSVPVSTYLPDWYVTDPRERLAIYRRLADCESVVDVLAIRDEVEDRYGRCGTEAKCLFQAAQLKTMAWQIGATRLNVKDATLTVTLGERADVLQERIDALLKTYQGRITFVSPLSFKITVSGSTWEDQYLEAARCLSQLKKSS